MNTPSISLIIPCYNESERIDLLFNGIMKFSKEWQGNFEIIIIDDGSNDDTYKLIHAHSIFCTLKETNQISVIHQQNTGKGGALKLGVANSKNDFILTLDADMATSPLQLIEWLHLKKEFQQDEILIGSRELTQSVIDEIPLRKWIGNRFNAIIRNIVGIHFHDTQCGFKLYPANIARQLFVSLKTMGWSHDVELIARAIKHGFKVIEMPVTWTAVKGSKINVLKDSWVMFWEVVNIRRMPMDD